MNIPGLSDSPLSFFFRVRKIDQVIRFNTMPRISDQPVSIHTHHVSEIILVICLAEQLSAEVTCSALQKGIVHDWDEVEISDIPHYVKHHPKFGVGGDLQAIAAERLSQNLFSDLPGPLSERLLKLVTEAKSPDIAGRLVSFADMYELSIHCLFEVSLGNLSFWPIYRHSHALLSNPEKYPIIQELRFCSQLVEYLPKVLPDTRPEDLPKYLECYSN